MKQGKWNSSLFASIAIALGFIAIATTPTHAEDDTGKIVANVPAEISQIISGGSWKNDKNNGFYRTIVVNSGDKPDNLTTHVYIQWLEVKKGRPHPKILKSMAIKEVGEKKLSNAFADADGEKENEIVVLVSSYDAKNDKDIEIWVKATQPGEYKIVPPQVDKNPPEADKEPTDKKK